METSLTLDSGDTHRASKDDLERQISYFANSDLICQLLNAVPSIYLILNSNRQIVYFNASFEQFLGAESSTDIYGLRPGEALKCLNLKGEKNGCGSTKFCENCGALQAILSSLRGNKDIQECKINLQSGESYEFRVHSKPMKFNGENFVLFSLTDIRHEKRRQSLERVFYHDILNSAGALQGVVHLIGEHLENKDSKITELGKMAVSVAHRLVDDIRGQRDLSLAENNELLLQPTLLKPSDILEEVVAEYRYHRAGKNKNIMVWHPEESDFPMVTDGGLLRRILGNLLKNALEASAKGDTVSTGWKLEKKLIQFYVHNSQHMSEEQERNIFHRAFSTKGSGRGLGTYSVKLFTERYLGGKIYFTTDQLAGTTVYIELPLALKTVKK